MMKVRKGLAHKGALRPEVRTGDDTKPCSQEGSRA